MPVYQYALASATSGFTTGNGTISVSASSTALTGATTTFTTDLHVGDVIYSSGQYMAVSSITDNTHLTLQSASGINISSAAWSYNHLVNVETFVTPPFAPKSVPKPWYQGVDTGDGLARGMGRPVTTWQFCYVTQGFRNALRASCTSKAARVFVRSREIDNSDDFLTYMGAMLWPDLENREATRRISFNVEFRDLIVL